MSGALDWEVVEGRREGEVRAGLAEKIRKLRRRNGEQSESDSSEEGPKDESREQLMHELRQQTGIKEWDGIQGDLILGRHTWKEYIRGLHEGWLGPLSQRQLPSQPSQTDDPSLGMSSPDLSSTEHSTESSSQEKPIPEESPAPNPQPTKPSKSTPAPPYISPAEYSSRSVSPTLNGPLNPSLPLPLPHVLGFFNTPTRLYRFLTRRQLADSTGRSVAALVLATHSRPYGQSADYVSAIDPDESSPSAASDRGTDSVVLAKEAWEQEVVLKQEEKEWHKSVWKPNAEGDEEERVWQVPVIVDSRIGQRMREFDLANGEDENAARVDAQKRLEADTSIQQFCKWIGWTEQKKKGWEMGLEGDENE